MIEPVVVAVLTLSVFSACAVVLVSLIRQAARSDSRRSRRQSRRRIARQSDWRTATFAGKKRFK